MALTKVSRGLLSTSIVDNGNATAITIDANENVGIGTASPTGGATTVVDVYGLSSSAINFHNATAGTTATEGGVVGQYGNDLVLFNYEAGIIQLGTSNTERMRIDASGNLLVGTTSTSWTDTDGLRFFNGGSLISTLSGGPAAYFNRRTNDGNIVVFSKNGSPVGSIGTGSGLLTIGTGTGNLVFENALVAPCSDSSVGSSNGVVDLGTSSRRFKDLHLSGHANFTTAYAATGIYLGAYASPNLLDDYEEGTWTPTDVSGDGLSITTNGVSYTKIGRLCYIYAYITYPSTASGSAQSIGGLPFTAKGSQTYAQLTVRVTSNTVSASNLTFQISTSANSGIIHDGSTAIVNSDISNHSILISGCYEVA